MATVAEVASAPDLIFLGGRVITGWLGTNGELQKLGRG